MNIQFYPDFNHVWQIGDRLIYEQTVIPVDGAPALVATNIILVPAGAKKGRSVIFVDSDPAQILANIETDEGGA